MGDTHLCQATTVAAIAERAIEVSGGGRWGGGIALAGTGRNDMVCVWIIIVGVIVILISGGSAAGAWNGAHGETGAGATVGKEGIIYGRAIAGTISACCRVVVVIKWSAMEARGGESGGDGGVVLKESGAAAAADSKEDPENNGGGGKANQDKDTSNSTGVAKKTGKKMRWWVDENIKGTNAFPFEGALSGERVGFAMIRVTVTREPSDCMDVDLDVMREGAVKVREPRLSVVEMKTRVEKVDL